MLEAKRMPEMGEGIMNSGLNHQTRTQTAKGIRRKIVKEHGDSKKKRREETGVLERITSQREQEGKLMRRVVLIGTSLSL